MNENEIECQQVESDSDPSISKCRVIVEQSNAVEAGAELTVSSSTNNDVSGTQPDAATAPRIFYSTLNEDDTFTDEDFDLLLEGKPSSTYVPLACCHMTYVQSVPASGIDIKAPCARCNSTDENWICLTCYEVYCSRYVNKHMVEHTQESSHPITLSFSDVTVWCYGCDDYVHGDVLDEARGIVMNAKYGSLQDGLTFDSNNS